MGLHEFVIAFDFVRLNRSNADLIKCQEITPDRKDRVWFITKCEGFVQYCIKLFARNGL